MRVLTQVAPFVLAVAVAGIGMDPVSDALAQDKGGPANASPRAASTGVPVAIANSEQFDLRSRSGLEYRIFVAGPAGRVPESGSPVIYLSDGNGNFPVLLAAARRQSREGLQAVVVGIGYPSDDEAVHRERRSFDLTPALSEGVAGSVTGVPAPVKSGGNDRFLAFLEDELKPLIERRYKVDRRRQALFGHSFGGLFVLHALFRRPESFQTYLASSPSLWWNDGSILAEEKAFAEKYAGKEVGARLLISVGEWEQRPGPGLPKERAAVLERRRMVGGAKDLASRLAASPVKGLAVEFREFPEEEHGSVVLPAASRGVRFALDGR